MKGKLSTIILVLIFIVGAALLLYPSVADYWNQKVQSKAIASYETMVSKLTDDECKKHFDLADDYNARLRKLSYPFVSYDEVKGYYGTMDVTGNGIIGYISIEKIKVELPIYHGTTADVLNAAVGHLQGSSLPVGGPGTHAVLSAHRGLPSAKLFTHLDRMEIGDTFTITVLNRVLTYEVDSISIVTPDKVDSLYIIDNEDHCTLMTCTPYGINSHRLLVRGTRTESATGKPPVYIENEAFSIDPLIVAPAVSVPILTILLAVLLIKYRKKKKGEVDIGQDK